MFFVAINRSSSVTSAWKKEKKEGKEEFKKEKRGTYQWSYFWRCLPTSSMIYSALQWKGKERKLKLFHRNNQIDQVWNVSWSIIYHMDKFGIPPSGRYIPPLLSRLHHRPALSRRFAVFMSPVCRASSHRCVSSSYTCLEPILRFIGWWSFVVFMRSLLQCLQVHWDA